MSYSSVQFIAYPIYTGPHFGVDGKKSYVGLSEQKQDFDARIALLKRAIALAYENAVKDSSVLKIFMLPEFFFRGQKGAYEYKDGVNSIDFLLAKLCAAIKAEQWSDWLFVFGTILCEVKMPTLSPSPNNEKFVLNFSLVQRGGLNTSGLERIIPKINKSGMDFIKEQETLSGDVFFHEAVVHPLTVNENKLRAVLQKFLALDPSNIQALLISNGIEQNKWQALEKKLKDAKSDIFVVREVRKAQIPTKEKPISQMSLDVEGDWKSIARKIINSFFTSNKKKLNITSNITFPQLTEEELKRILNIFLNDSDAFSKQCSLAGIPDQQHQLLKNKLDHVKNSTQDILSIRQSSIPQIPKSLSELNVQDDTEGWAFAKKLLEIYIDQHEKDKNSKELLFLNSDPLQFVLEASTFSHQLLSGLKQGLSGNKEVNSSLQNIRNVPYVFNLQSFYKKTDDMPKKGFDFKDIIFGLEICYDHGIGLLKRNVGEYHFKGNLPSVDIQLITSGGMRLGEPYIVTKENGYIFFCDGYNPDLGEPNPNAIVEQIKFNDTKEGIKRPCSEARKKGGFLKDVLAKKDLNGLKEIEAAIKKIPVPSHNVEIPSGNNTSISISISNLYAQGVEDGHKGVTQQGAGKLHIYPPQSLEFAKPISTSNSVFPNSIFVGSLSSEPILLNGMKVIFDRPVSVYPVTLESKAEARRNGNG